MKRMSLIAPLLAFGLIAGACSDNGSDSGVASLEGQLQDDATREEAVQTMTEEEAIFAFTACLRIEGIDVEDPEVDADGNLRPPRPRDVGEEDREAMRTAFQACGEYLEDATFGFTGGDDAEREDMLVEYASCMRENGYDMPDPDFSAPREPGQGGGGPFGGGIDPEDPAFQAAHEACADVVGDLGRIPGAGGGPGGRGGQG